MIKVENYPNAYKEVFVILKNVDKDLFNKIPTSFINMINNKMNKNYNFELDKNIDFEEQSLLKETKVILAYVLLNYWSTKEQKDRIMQKFRQDIIIEERKKPKYNPEKVFRNHKNQNTKNEVTPKEENHLIKYKSQNIFEKILNIIKKIFKRNK